MPLDNKLLHVCKVFKMAKTRISNNFQFLSFFFKYVLTLIRRLYKLEKTKQDFLEPEAMTPKTEVL